MTKQNTSKEIQIVDFSTFNIQQLPEFKGKKEEIKSVIKANPVIKITDNATYELAKKSRTTVRSTRTGLENEKKEVANKIKTHVLNVVNNEYDLLIEEVRSEESLRQEEVTRWEDIKEQERLEKLRLEQERIDGIKAKIDEIGILFVNKVQGLSFASISEFEEELTLFKTIQDKALFQEFEVLYNDKMDYIDNLFEAKRKTLTEQEEIRLEQIRLAEERAENERKSNIQNSITKWYNDWSVAIDILSFFNYSGYFSDFQNEKPLNCQEFQSEFTEKRALLVQKFESKIALLNQIEENRIAAEKLAQEKAEFEAKQKEARFEERKKALTEIGAISNGEAFVHILYGFVERVSFIKDCSDDEFSSFLTNYKIFITEQEIVVEEPQTEVLPESNYHEADVDPKGVVISDVEIPEDPIRKTIFATIEDLCSDFLFYDRKEDEDLSAFELKEAVKNGIITIDEMVREFRKHLINTLTNEQ
jgi:hypothetical protein